METMARKDGKRTVRQIYLDSLFFRNIKGRATRQEFFGIFFINILLIAIFAIPIYFHFEKKTQNYRQVCAPVSISDEQSENISISIPAEQPESVHVPFIDRVKNSLTSPFILLVCAFIIFCFLMATTGLVVRRLHDINKTGSDAIIFLIALLVYLSCFYFREEMNEQYFIAIGVVGTIILLVYSIAICLFMVRPGIVERNKYGINPRFEEKPIEEMKAIVKQKSNRRSYVKIEGDSMTFAYYGLSKRLGYVVLGMIASPLFIIVAYKVMSQMQYHSEAVGPGVFLGLVGSVIFIGVISTILRKIWGTVDKDGLTIHFRSIFGTTSDQYAWKNFSVSTNKEWVRGRQYRYSVSLFTRNENEGSKGNTQGIMIQSQPEPFHEEFVNAVRQIEHQYLTDVSVSEMTLSILDQEFCKCPNLTSVRMADSVKKIGHFAFAECNKLSTILLSQCIESIGLSAFTGCRSLKEIALPASVRLIGIGTFVNCVQLTRIEVDDKNQYFKSDDGVLFSKDGTTLICYPEGRPDRTYRIPDCVTTINTYAFHHCVSLETLEIPNNVVNIAKESICCKDLTLLTQNPIVIQYANENNMKAMSN